MTEMRPTHWTETKRRIRKTAVVCRDANTMIRFLWIRRRKISSLLVRLLLSLLLLRLRVFLKIEPKWLRIGAFTRPQITPVHIFQSTQKDTE